MHFPTYCQTALSVAVSATLSVIAGVSAPPTPVVTRLVLDDVTIVDGNGTAGVPHRDLLVIDGRIGAIAPHRASAWPGTPRLSVAGRFVVPGYIDMHEHVAVERWTMRPTGEKAATFDSALSATMLRVLLAYGVTTVRNPGSWIATTREQVALREKTRRATESPHIVTAGRILSDPSIADMELKREIQAQADAGVDFIKLYSALPPTRVSEAIALAHARHLPVTGHLQATPWRTAANAGIDFIEHGASWSPADLPATARVADSALGGMRGRLAWLALLDVNDSAITSTIAALRDHHVVVTPTLVAFQSKFWGYDSAYHLEPANGLLPTQVDDWRILGTFTDDWTPEDFARARQLWPRLLRLTKRLHDEHVLITAGADVGSPWVAPGAGLHREFRLLNDAGLSPLEVLRVATRNGADALHELDSVGTVTVGKRADLIVLRRDPSIDVGALSDIEYVLRDGNPVRPDSLLPSVRERLQEGTITTSDGATLHYYVDGGGARDTLLIPLGVILEPELRSLAARHTLVLYDPRGRGHSSSLVPSLTPARDQAFARDLADLETIRAHFKISKPVVVGWSFYSLLVARYAIEHPATTRSVILLSPLAPRRTPYADEMNAEFGRRLDPSALGTLDGLRRTRKSVLDSINYCRRNAALYVPANMSDRGRSVVLHTDPCWLRNEWPEQSALASGRSLESLGDFDWRHDLRAMKVPLLIVHGRQDASPVEGVREWLEAPNSRMLELEHAAHWTFIERGAAVDSAINAFLRSDRRPPSRW